jgi:hypothetical protein
MTDNAHGFDVKEIPVAKIGFHQKKNGSDMELAQISEYYLKLTYSNLRLYIPGRTQGNTKPKYCHVVLKIQPMSYFHRGKHT